MLLALELPEEGKPKVNKSALTLIRECAAKSELYSHECREHLMSVMSIKARIDIFELATTARAVFEEIHIMLAALLREALQDRVLMKSHFSHARTVNQDETHENDTNYSLRYLKKGYYARNNILWRSGVPF